MARIFIIDDDELLCKTLTQMLGRKKHLVSSAYTISDALKKCNEEPYDIVFLDVRLPDGDGLSIIPELKKTASEPEIIIMTGLVDPDGAEIAIKSGAWCYLEKSSITRELLLPLTRALQYREEKARVIPPKILKREKIIGNSPQLNKCLELLADATCSDVNVLITGETGTGKEVFARTIHQNSPRAEKGNFVVVDCSALPENLVESILFGYAKGAFTGADRSRKGLVQQADGGTLFLDEVGELPMHVQKSFLRLLQDRRFRPVGESVEEESNFRLIVATNRNLDEMVSKGTFRKDLLYRLHSLVIELPPLRARGDDILDLANFFIDNLSRMYNQDKKHFSPELIETLKMYAWPGNVRELFNALDMMFATAFHHPAYHTLHLPEKIRIESIKYSIRNTQALPADDKRSAKADTLFSWEASKNEFEYEYIQNLLTKTNYNITEACRVSGLSRAWLYKLINKHGFGQTGAIQKSDKT